MSLSQEEIAYEEAHINQDRAYQQIVPIAIFGFLAFVCVIFRIAGRKIGRIALGLDDYLIIASMVQTPDRSSPNKLLLIRLRLSGPDLS